MHLLRRGVMYLRLGVGEHLENRAGLAAAPIDDASIIAIICARWRSGCASITSTSNFIAAIPLTVLRRDDSRDPFSGSEASAC
jgi:hypothetical protein